MQIGSFDFETELIRPGYLAPAPVCLTWQIGVDGVPQFATTAGLGVLGSLLRSGVVWGGVNVGFDLAVAASHGVVSFPEVFAALDAGLIIDLGTFERVAEIGGWTTRKRASLALLHAAYGLGDLTKDSAVRLAYGPLRGAPLAAYSSEQLEYALRDAKAGVDVFDRQLKRWSKRINLADVAFLTRKAFWLCLVSAWGLRTDPSRVDVLERETVAAVSELQALAQNAGIVRPDGTRDMGAIRAIVAEAYDGTPPFTVAKKDRKSEKPFVPQIRTDKDTLLASGNPVLETLADFGSWKSILSGDLENLKRGTVEPIHTRFGLADTTRSTSSKPNVQNVRRSARKDCACGRSAPSHVRACPACGGQTFTPRQGIRECFVPRPGYCFVAIDHGGLELCTLAQCCVTLLGRTDMSTKINRGDDLHLHVAAEILNLPYSAALERKAAADPEMLNARNCGKVVNFGRPGGMAAPTLVLYAKQSYGVEMDLPFAERLIESWNRANPDGQAYLQYVRRLRVGERFNTVIPGTTIQRNQTTYCSAANCGFQGLGAVLEAAVGYEIAREQYAAAHGALRYTRTVNFIHDEYILECPIGLQTAVALRLQAILCGPVVRRFLPDVKISAEAVAMTRWSKSAKPKWIDGELQICVI